VELQVPARPRIATPINGYNLYMAHEHYPSSKIFNWIFIFFVGLWTAGAYVDGWAHINLDSSLETFFTPWHAIFYLGIIATALSLIVFLIINLRRGYPLKHALPKEYLFSLIGVGLALAGGVGDMLWHGIFGIEEGIEALLSPTHLVLAIGGAIATAGPLYAVWHREKSRPIHAGPTVLSAAYFISTITFMVQFLHPFALPWSAESFTLSHSIPFNYTVMLGVANILVLTVIFTGTILSLIKRWIFPFGSFAIILTINALAITLMKGGYYQFILSALIAGLLIDICDKILIKKNIRRMPYIHMFSFIAPFILFSTYMATIFLTDNMIWSVHMWSGVPVIAGIAGYLTSYLAIPSEQD